jgi:hypothetical protein
MRMLCKVQKERFTFQIDSETTILHCTLRLARAMEVIIIVWNAEVIDASVSAFQSDTLVGADSDEPELPKTEKLKQAILTLLCLLLTRKFRIHSRLFWSSGLMLLCWNSSSAGCLELLQHWIKPQWLHIEENQYLELSGLFCSFLFFEIKECYIIHVLISIC